MNEAPEANDADLLRRTRGGDRAAAEVFVSRHLDAVLRYARALCQDAVAAEDVAQDVLFAALRGQSELVGTTAGAWLLVSTRHAVFRQGRRRAGEPDRFVPLDELGLAAGWGEDPEARFGRLEDNARLAAALDALPDEDREVLVLRELEELSGEQTAETLGITLAAMKSRLHRARLRLMATLREGGTDDRAR